MIKADDEKTKYCEGFIGTSPCDGDMCYVARLKGYCVCMERQDQEEAEELKDNES